LRQEGNGKKDWGKGREKGELGREGKRGKSAFVVGG